jgi:hypothetical protein
VVPAARAAAEAPVASEVLRAAIERGLAEGRGVSLEGDVHGVVVSELPSGTRFAIDPSGAYWVIGDDGRAPARFLRSTHGPDELPNGTEGRFAEALEVPRHDFEDGLEAGARAADLPVQETLLAFPTMELLQAMLAASSAYTARLALRWMLPSERSDLAAAIARIAKDAHMTQDVRDLARHLGG